MSHSSHLNEIAILQCIPGMERETICSIMMFMTVFFDEVNKIGHVWVKVFISFINFKVGGGIFFNSVLSVMISLFVIVINKVRIVHNILQEMRSKNSSTDKDRFSFNNFAWRCSKFMLEFTLWTLMFYNCCVIVNFCFLSLRFNKTIKCIIGGFHIYRSSFWLIKWRPIIPFIWMFRFEYLHIFRWRVDNFLNV